MATVDAQVKKADITTARCRKKAARNRFGDRKLLVGSARTSKTSPESFPGPVRSRLNPTLLTSLARPGSIPVPGKSAYPLRCPVLLINSNPASLRAAIADAGTDGRQLAKWLKNVGIRQIPAVVLTHNHDDHIRGVTDLVEAFAGKVGKIYSVIDETTAGSRHLSKRPCRRSRPPVAKSASSCVPR